ncbi:MAG: CotH kinase family protein [Pseudomonadales bacterium]
MKRILGRCWAWSWVITLPIVCFFAYWVWDTAQRYYTFGIRYDTRPIPYTLHSTGEKVFHEMTRTLRQSIGLSTQDVNEPIEGINVVNIFVPESNLAQLNANLPHSGFEYVKGGIWNEGKLQKMKFKYRGDFVYHWGETKKSLRVKTSKGKLYRGHRTFNLLGIKQLETHYGNLLAKDFGLIAPSSDIVEVNLNGERLGLHVYVEQLEELTLRNNGYMPGDIYSGEIVAKDAYRGVEGNLFTNPRLWEKIAINNHFAEDSLVPLETLIGLINDADNPETQAKLSKMLDMDAWGRFSAFETLTHGFHYDNHHNWRLYYDPMRSKFFPVIWDPLAWHRNWRTNVQLDIIPSDFHLALFKNAEFLEARAQAIANFFLEERDTRFLDQLYSHIPGFKEALDRDPLLNEPLDVAYERVDAFIDLVETVFANAEAGYLGTSSNLAYSTPDNSFTPFTIDLSVSGRMPVKRLYLDFSEPVSDVVAARLKHLLDETAQSADVSSKISVNGATVVLEQTLLAQHTPFEGTGSVLRRTKLAMSDAYYQLALTGIKPGNRLLDMRAEFFDDREILARRLPSIAPKSFDRMYLVVKDAPVVKPIIWSGEVRIDGIQELDAPLVIRPGTTVYFGDDASLILRNRILAEGTAEEPIRFLPAKDATIPWGTLTLTGSGTDYSRFVHTEFAGGSGLKRPLYEYTAMLSIHGAKGVDIEHTLFRDSKITDDMVHAVYADVRFSHTVFERALMDALDIDIATGVIENSRFSNSGNDSIDFMTSHGVVRDTIIEDGGDKAASVGEGSTLLVINSIFRNNFIGVQAKDGSSAALYNLDLIGNGQALDGYNKNWRYNDGGDIYTYKSFIQGNKKPMAADKKSSINIFDSFIDADPKSVGKRIELGPNVDNQQQRKPKLNTIERHLDEIESMSVFDPTLWRHVDHEKRGASNVITD